MRLVLLVFILAQASFACECLVERGILLTGLGAVALEATSAGTAYFARSDVGEKEQKNLYLWQAGTLGGSALALTLGLLISKGQLSSKIAGVILVDALIGTGLGVFAYQKNTNQTMTTKASVTSGVLGLGAHLANIGLLIFKAALCCRQDPDQAQDYLTQV